jgi:hypothetical protein
VCQAPGLKDVVGDEHHGCPPTMVELEHVFLDNPHVVGVEVGSRLIEEQYLGLEHNGAGKSHPLGLPARKGTSALVLEMRQTDQPQCIRDPIIGVLVAAHPEPVGDIGRHASIKQ